MISALVTLKSLIKTKSYHIDHPLFRLHYQVTVAALLAFCLVLTAKILFGDTIDCKGRSQGRDPFYDNLCYSQGTTTRYAIDTADLRLAAAGLNPTQQPTSASGTVDSDGAYSPQLPKPQTSGLDQISAKLETLSDEQKSARAALVPKTTSKSSGFVSEAAGYIMGSLFPEEAPPPPPLALPLVSDSGSPQLVVAAAHPENLTESSTSLNVNQNTFPNSALSGTEVGRFLKNQFRQIHKIIKSSNLNFDPSVRYLYPGIMIPRDVVELYSTTFWHRYYQYIPIILFLQAVFFYLPHYLWKNWENGIVSSICKQLHDNRFAPNEYIESNHHMLDYLHNCFTFNRRLVYQYYFCHVLLLINIIAQIIVLNAIFNNQFVTYGIDVFDYIFIDNDVYGLRGIEGGINDLNNPMDFVFPKVTECDVKVLSASGKVLDRQNFMCVLPLNILNDKFFLILWFWYLILAIITVLQIIFDVLYVLLPVLRKYLFSRRFGPYLSEDNRRSTSLPELFLLDLIGSNSDRFAFSALLKKLNKEDWRASPSENQSIV